MTDGINAFRTGLLPQTLASKFGTPATTAAPDRNSVGKPLPDAAVPGQKPAVMVVLSPAANNPAAPNASAANSELAGRSREALGIMSQARQSGQGKSKETLRAKMSELGRELKILRMMGRTPREIAREAARIARELSKIARNYAALGQSDSATPTPTGTPAIASATASAALVAVVTPPAAPVAPAAGETTTEPRAATAPEAKTENVKREGEEEGKGEREGEARDAKAPAETPGTGVAAVNPDSAHVSLFLVTVKDVPVPTTPPAQTAPAAGTGANAAKDPHIKALALKAYAQGTTGDSDGPDPEPPKDPDDAFFFSVYRLLGHIRKTIKEAHHAERLRHGSGADPEFKACLKQVGEVEDSVTEDYVAMKGTTPVTEATP